MTISKGKRPGDPNQLAKWVVEQSTSETPTQEQEAQPKRPPVSPAELSKQMAALGRKGGRIGRETSVEDHDPGATPEDSG